MYAAIYDKRNSKRLVRVADQGFYSQASIYFHFILAHSLRPLCTSAPTLVRSVTYNVHNQTVAKIMITLFLCSACLNALAKGPLVFYAES